MYNSNIPINFLNSTFGKFTVQIIKMAICLIKNYYHSSPLTKK